MKEINVIRPLLGDNFTPVAAILKRQDTRRLRALSTIAHLIQNILPNPIYYAIHWDQIVSVFFKDVKIVRWSRLLEDGEKFPTVVTWTTSRKWKDVVLRIFKLTGWSMASKVELATTALTIIHAILGIPTTGIEIAVATSIAYRIFVIAYFYQMVIKKSKNVTLTYVKENGPESNYILAHDAIVRTILNLTLQLLTELSSLLPEEGVLVVGALTSVPSMAKEMVRSSPRVKTAACTCVGTCSYDFILGTPTCYIAKGSEKKCRDYGASVFDRMWNASNKKVSCHADTGQPIMPFFLHGKKKHKAKIRKARIQHRRKQSP